MKGDLRYDVVIHNAILINPPVIFCLGLALSVSYGNICRKVQSTDLYNYWINK